MPLIAMDDGIRLNVEAEPDNGKPPLLFLNALGTDLSLWDDQVPAFREHFRVIRFDDRGHGASDAPDMPYTIDRLGRDARAVLDELGVETAHVVGLSKGGATALWLAINSPDHIDKAVAACCSPHMPPRDVWTGRARTARSEGLDALAEAAIGRWFTEGYRSKSHDAIARIRSMILGTSPEGYAACCEALAELDLRDDLELIQVPMLVVCGDSDATAQPAKTREWLRQVEGAELAVIKSAAHLANVEQPAAFNKTVLDFLLG